MIQIFPKCVSQVGYGSAVQHAGIIDGNGIMTFDIGRAPMPFAGTLRNFTVYCGVAHPSVKVQVLLDGFPSGVELTLASGISQVSDAIGEVFYTAGQTLTYRTITTVQIYPGFEMAFCVELNSTAQAFGVVAHFGSSVGAGSKEYAGALGNGFWAELASSYSINALEGSATRLMLRRFTAQSGGSWKANLELDGVLQDGTVGTVDTTCELFDADASGLVSVDFDLPAQPTQHLNVVLERLGSTATFGLEQVGAGIAFRPTKTNGFMLVGGSNDAIPIPGTSWKWNHSGEFAATIERHQAAIGGKAIRLTSLYVEHTQPPTAGESFTDTILNNGVPSDISVVLTDSATSGSDFGTQVCGIGDRVTIELVSTAGANPVAKFYWAMAGEVGPAAGVIGPLLWWRFRRRVPTT